MNINEKRRGETDAIVRKGYVEPVINLSTPKINATKTNSQAMRLNKLSRSCSVRRGFRVL